MLIVLMGLRLCIFLSLIINLEYILKSEFIGVKIYEQVRKKLYTHSQIALHNIMLV